MLNHYLKNHWRANPDGLLFPNRNGRPHKREHVVKFGLKPILRKLNLPRSVSDSMLSVMDLAQLCRTAGSRRRRSNRFSAIRI
jgi:hypothetical protein